MQSIFALFGVIVLVASMIFLLPLIPVSKPYELLSEKNLIDDDVLLGPDAPVLIVEFGDYTCESCAELFQIVEPSLRKEFIETGKARMIFRDFINPGTLGGPAALVATCAPSFWQTHDWLYGNAYSGERWVDNPNALVAYARTLGLDTCVKQENRVQEVQSDSAAGLSLSVIGTPTLFIGNEKKGFVRILGAQPYIVYKTFIEDFLDD